MTQVIVDAAVEAGIPFNDDYNGAHQEGVGYLQVTQKDGKRWSAADAWLRPAMSRKNLTVRTGVQALGVVIEAGRAIGVSVWTGNGSEVVRARREVILSAGSIGTPQLLMLSGIGPADHLRRDGPRRRSWTTRTSARTCRITRSTC